MRLVSIQEGCEAEKEIWVFKNNAQMFAREEVFRKSINMLDFAVRWRWLEIEVLCLIAGGLPAIFWLLGTTGGAIELSRV